MEGLKPGLLTWKALLANPRPNCRQTTMASTMPQFSPHTVPHTRDPFLSTSTSTRPSKGFRPPFRRSCREKGRHGHQEGWRGMPPVPVLPRHRVLPGTLDSTASLRAMFSQIKSCHRHPGPSPVQPGGPWTTTEYHSRGCLLEGDASGQVLAWFPGAPPESTGGALL